ncbi:MAG: gliding motility-associated C-terminal domain-containing protein [Bacteroidota bacterium]
MRIGILLIVICYLSGLSLNGQYEDRFWIMGRTNSPTNTTNATFDFYPDGANLYTTPAPPAFSPGPINISRDNGFEGWGVVTDPQTGRLLFYSDGRDVFDANHQNITPPGGLGANPSSSQAVAIAINPICPFNQYYIFSNPTGVAPNDTRTGPVTYRLYTVGEGFSAVTALPGPAGDQPVGEGMIVVPSTTDPYTSWLIVRALEPVGESSDYLVYQVDPSGISFGGKYNFGPPIPPSPIVNMAYVQTGSGEEVIVGFSASRSPTNNHVFTNTFNTATGTFGPSANLLASFPGGILYDLEFSPEGQFVYYATYFPSALYQVPIAGGASQLMRNFGNLRAGGLKRGPEGHVYHVYDAGSINNTGRVRIGKLVSPETPFNGTNFNELYAADFNSSVNLIFSNTFAYNFPEFVSTPVWSAAINANFESPFCPGDEAILSLTVNSLGQNIESYAWWLNDTLLTETAVGELAITTPGTYRAIVNLASGCTISSESIMIGDPASIPTIDEVTMTPSSCNEASGSISITASGNGSPLLYSLDGGAFTTNAIFTELPVGTFQVSVSYADGCPVTAVVEVTGEAFNLEIDTVEIQPETCLGQDGSVEVRVRENVGQVEYALNGGPFQTGNQFLSLSSGDYEVTVRDETTCSVSTLIVVPQQNDGPVINEIQTSPVSCLGGGGSLTVIAESPNDGDLQYALDDSLFTADGVFTTLSAGGYELRVTDGIGCQTAVSVEIEVANDFPQVQQLNLVDPLCDLGNGSVEVVAESENGGLTYSLNGANFVGDNTFLGLLPQLYNLTVQDALGCSLDTTFVLVEGVCPVFVPNAFSPNADGINDQLEILSRPDQGTTVEVYRIYDRWGELVYEAEQFSLADQDQYWDGTFRGEMATQGVYVCVFTLRHPDGTSDTLAKEILLIR